MQFNIVLGMVAIALVSTAVLCFFRIRENWAIQRRNQADFDREDRNVQRWAAKQQRQHR